MRTPSQELLWELSRVETDSDEAILSDELLNTYRSGDLPAEQIARVEAVLARTARSRARLAELAGTRIEQPPRQLRRRILGESTTKAGRNGQFRYLAAAAIVVAILAPIVYWQMKSDPSAPSALPGGLDFQIRVEGLAQVRSGTGLPEAFPDTRVRIVLEPWREAEADLDFALYREMGGAMHRLQPGAQLDVQVSRGSVTFVTRADSLVEPAPGEHEFFIVVAREGTLPERVQLDPSRSTEATLKDAAVGLVYRRSLTVLDSGTTR